MLVTPTAYFAPVSHFALAIQQGCWQWEAHENYQKGGLRNRCHISGPNQVELLSIPLVKGKHQSTPIQEVKISYVTDWVRLHKRSIAAAYGRSPYFDHYSQALFGILEKRPEKLWSLNNELHQEILKVFVISDLFTTTDKYNFRFLETVIDLRKKSKSVPIQLEHYPQVFEDRHGFLSDLSILDLLFCLGPGGGVYLRKYKK
ncbi:MAG: WbqC family protein [Bacteroidota bacterium]